ncbi:MAG: hypothetical protein HRT87_03215 [Legionellales bacterium]|nr:hypothetical protein [Legionellales bacterium]
MSAVDRIKDEARYESAKKIALNKLEENLDLELISKVTELTIDQIE